MKKYSSLGIANRRFNPEFEQWKREIFDFVKGNFEPSYKDDTIDDYTFFIDKTRWIVRYDRGIKCRLLFIDGKVLINKYDEVSEFFIEAEGYVNKWYPHAIMDEDFTKALHKEQSLLLSEFMTVKIEQESGKRKIVYPKEKMHGCISRKDYYSGMDDWQRQNYWALKFSVDDIEIHR